jgi:hypothetical protein
MWDRSDNQEVGLEAAILERVRNSSLVKWFRADNVAGLKHTAEAVALPRALSTLLEGAGQGWGWVGERRVAGEAAEESSRGRHTSENAGMSSERGVRNSPAG